MPEFSPQDLAAWTGGKWHEGEPASVTGFCQDSRKIGLSECFVALTTGKRDGHDYLADAREAGASCALVNHVVPGAELCQLVVTDVLTAFQSIAAQHRQAFKGLVIGVTGSCGKTTTKDLLATLLGPRTLRTEGNLNNFIGVPLTLTRLDNAKHDFAVVEAGINEPGEMDMLARLIDADTAICTMVGPAHLEKLGSVEGIASEKSRLGALSRRDVPVLFPADCLRFEPFRAFGARACVAAPPGAELPGGGFHRIDYRTNETNVSGCRLEVEPAALRPGIYELPFNSPGLISNAVLAITTAKLCGAKPEDIVKRLRDWLPGSHRGQWFKSAGCAIYDDAYNANPASMAESLAAFVTSAPVGSPRLFVLGGMKELGGESHALHVKVGSGVPWRDGDGVVLVGAEAPGYLEGLKSLGVPAAAIQVFDRAEEAASVLTDFQGAVFLKGSRAYALERILDYIPRKQEAAC